MSRMARLGALVPSLSWLPAFAQEAAKEAPVEKADPMVVIGFLLFLVGSCAGYVAYMYWSRRKSGKDE